MAVYEFAPKAKNSNHIWICDGDTFLNDRGDWVEIKHDWDCESPREYDNLGTFYTWLRSYGSPDDAPYEVEDLFAQFNLEDEWEQANAAVARDNEPLIAEYNRKRVEYKNACDEVRHRIEVNKSLNTVHRMMDKNWVDQNFFDWMDCDPFAFPVEPKRPTMKRYPNPLSWFIAKLNELGHYALPVSAYIHSGIVYRVGSPSQFPDSQFDAGYAGLIFVTKDKVKKWFMTDDLDNDVRKRVNRCLADEVEYYSEWAEGCTYGYVMTDHETLEEDSCWGFIGSDAIASGLVDYTGELHDTNLGYDEWYEQVEEMQLEEQESEDFENMVGTTATSDSYAA